MEDIKTWHNTWIKGYKEFDHEWTCWDDGGKQYSCPGIFEEKEEPVLYQRGMHFGRTVTQCFTCLSKDEYDNNIFFNPHTHVAEVIAYGTIIEGLNKCCTNKLEIIREVPWYEVLELVNYGEINTGMTNFGNKNSGCVNDGNGNSGNCNVGNSNCGCWNDGRKNSGNSNYGNMNSSDCNYGNRNSGYYNNGNENSGNYNVGSGNSGNYNSGNYNSGIGNRGFRNSGNGNDGSLNSGTVVLMFPTKILQEILQRVIIVRERMELKCLQLAIKRC